MSTSSYTEEIAKMNTSETLSSKQTEIAKNNEINEDEFPVTSDQNINSKQNNTRQHNGMNGMDSEVKSEVKTEDILKEQITANVKFGKPFHIHIHRYEKNEHKHDSLRLVSWNVNMETLSAYCPHRWEQHNNKWDKIYQQTNEQNADIITFQEIPTAYNANMHYNKIHPLIRKYKDTKQWHITNSTRSHCGNSLILVNRRVENQYDVFFDTYSDWPAVILQKKIIGDMMNGYHKNQKYEYDHSKSLIIFGVHLMYGNQGSNERMLSFDRLYKFAKNKYNMNNNFVIIGDTNMRDYDENNVLKKYKNKGVTSCWNLVDPEYLKLNGFMATFYRNFFERGKPGTTRYDKIFCGKNIRCISFGIFDKCVSQEPFHFLSDHRGIVADIEII